MTCRCLLIDPRPRSSRSCLLVKPPPNDIVCSIMPKHRHVHKHNIYKFICLSAMNLKYLLRTSCIGCAPIHYTIQQVHTIYKREVICFYHKVMHGRTRKPKMCIQLLSAHTHSKQGEDGTWCPPLWHQSHKNTKMANPKCLLLRIWSYYCLLFFVIFASAQQW